MTTTDKVYNLIILDESGSMQSIKKATIGGFNEVVQTIKGIEKQFPEQQHFISLITFNGNGVKTLLDKQPVEGLQEINADTYQPDSMTPLYDAIGLSVIKLKNDIVGLENCDVLVTILTDGMENASLEFNGHQIKKIIEEQKALGWTFTYIGANQDSASVGAAISITNTMNFMANDEDMKVMFLKESESRIRYSQKIRNKEARGEDFYKED